MKKKFSPITGGRYTEVPSRDRYEPDSYDDMGNELPEEEIKLTVPIDDTFIIGGSSDIEESKETKYDWALQDGSDEDWYVEIDNYDIAIRNSEEIIDDALSVLIDNMPYKAGKYHVTCIVTLVYRVSGIITWEYQTGPSYHSERYDEDFADYDSGIDTEDMDVELVFGKCYVSNLKTELIK
jgi:hypothetical protein